MDTVGYIIGGSNCSHCLFFSGWRKRKHVSWECGCVVHVRWSDRIVQCNCKLKRGKFLSFFSLSCDRMLLNDAEHSWHLALMAFVLADYANEPVDVLKTMKMVLLHDVIEIDAGDTYAYDTEGNKTKRERELKAADRIFGLLPEAQQKEYRGLWDEFEAMETPESKFANMLDKVQPLFLNDASGGISWEEHGVKKSQVLKRDERVHEGSERIWEYAKSLIEKNAKYGKLIDE